MNSRRRNKNDNAYFEVATNVLVRDKINSTDTTIHSHKLNFNEVIDK